MNTHQASNTETHGLRAHLFHADNEAFAIKQLVNKKAYCDFSQFRLFFFAILKKNFNKIQFKENRKLIHMKDTESKIKKVIATFYLKIHIFPINCQLRVKKS